MSAPSTVQWLRAAVTRIAVGSGRRATYLSAWAVHRVRRVWARAVGWLSEGVGLGWALRLVVLVGLAALLRKIAMGLVVGMYHRVEDGGAPRLLWGAALWWIVSAYRAGVDGWKPKRPAVPAGEPSAEEPEEAPASPAEQAPAAPAGPWPVSPTELVAAVRDVGTPHAQLVPLAQHLGTSTDQVRATAAGMAWAVKDVRQDGRSASAGLRWDECPSPSEVHPSSTVVGAGRPADDNDDDTGGEGPRKGIRVERRDDGLTVYDLADHHRRRGTVSH